MSRLPRAAHYLAIAIVAMSMLAPNLSPIPRVAASPLLTLTKSSGYVEDPVTAAVSGFPKYRTVTFFWDGKALGSMRSTSTGDAFLTFPIPVAKKGPHEISATSSRTSASATFTVKPRLRVNPVATTVGSLMTLILRGFGKGESVEVAIDSTSKVLLSIVVSGSGSATIKLNTPTTYAGNHKLIATGNFQSYTSATVTIVPSVTLSPLSGSPGTTVRALVRGFAKGEQIEIQWIDLELHSHSLTVVTASSTGSANVNFTVPIGAAPGRYAVRIVGINGPNVAQIAFDVA